jgi:hypothetical protein
VTLEVSDSWDSVFKNNVQGQLTLSLPFGPKSRPKLDRDCCVESCDRAMTLAMRMVQPVARQEMIVIDSHKKTDPASDFFVFMDNESSSQGTYGSPYATLSDAQDNSSIGDIIYVFPGDGTTTGMAEGIILKNKQKFWGSGVGHGLKTNLGKIYIPALTSTSPQMTSGTDGIILGADNDVSGFSIIDTQRRAIFGDGNLGNTTITSCIISGANQYDDSYDAIDITYEGGSGNLVMNYLQVLDTAEGREGIYVAAVNGSNVNVMIANSIVSGNSFPIDLEVYDTAVMNAVLSNNSIMNNTNQLYLFSTSSLASSFTLNQNMIVGPTSSTNTAALFGDFRGSCIVSCVFNQNSISNAMVNEQAGLSIQTINSATANIVANGNRFFGNSFPIYTNTTDTSNVTFAANNNAMSGNANALFLQNSSTSSTTAVYTLSGNTVTGSGNFGFNGEYNGSGPVQLSLEDNLFAGNAGSANFSFVNSAASTLLLADNIFTGTTGSDGVTLTTNGSADLIGTITNNVFSNNMANGFRAIRTASTASTICLNMTGNASTGNGMGFFPYELNNGIGGGGHFNLAPCNAAGINFGGPFQIPNPLTNSLESCASGIVCP